MYLYERQNPPFSSGDHATRVLLQRSLLYNYFSFHLYILSTHILKKKKKYQILN